MFEDWKKIKQLEKLKDSENCETLGYTKESIQMELYFLKSNFWTGIIMISTFILTPLACLTFEDIFGLVWSSIIPVIFLFAILYAGAKLNEAVHKIFYKWRDSYYNQ